MASLVRPDWWGHRVVDLRRGPNSLNIYLCYPPLSKVLTTLPFVILFPFWLSLTFSAVILFPAKYATRQARAGAEPPELLSVCSQLSLKQMVLRVCGRTPFVSVLHSGSGRDVHSGWSAAQALLDKKTKWKTEGLVTVPGERRHRQKAVQEQSEQPHYHISCRYFPISALSISVQARWHTVPLCDWVWSQSPSELVGELNSQV